MSEWKKCSACKKTIEYNAEYYTCSVSTCRQKATHFIFCSVSCWSSHIAVFNHRNAFAEEQTAPAA